MFFCLFISANLSVSELLAIVYSVNLHVCLCCERPCHSAALVSLNHFSRALLLFFAFLFSFSFSRFSMSSLFLFVSAASGASLGKTSCVTPHPLTIWFSIHLQTCAQQAATHTHALTSTTDLQQHYSRTAFVDFMQILLTDESHFSAELSCSFPLFSHSSSPVEFVFTTSFLSLSLRCSVIQPNVPYSAGRWPWFTTVLSSWEECSGLQMFKSARLAS